MFQFPPELVPFMVLFLTNGIKSLLALVKIEVSGWWSVLVAAIVTGFLAFAASIVGGLPPAFQQLVVYVLTLLVGMGIHKTAKSLAGK